MPVLPDCPCGGQVVLEVDHDGAAEVCVRCGAAFWPSTPTGWREELKRRCRLVVEADRRGEL